MKTETIIGVIFVEDDHLKESLKQLNDAVKGVVLALQNECKKCMKAFGIIFSAVEEQLESFREIFAELYEVREYQTKRIKEHHKKYNTWKKLQKNYKSIDQWVKPVKYKTRHLVSG